MFRELDAVWDSKRTNAFFRKGERIRNRKFYYILSFLNVLGQTTTTTVNKSNTKINKIM